MGVKACRPARARIDITGVRHPSHIQYPGFSLRSSRSPRIARQAYRFSRIWGVLNATTVEKVARI